MAKHCRKLYKHPTDTIQDQQRRVAEHRAKANDHGCKLKVEHLLKARARLKTGKEAGGGDQIVVEMLKKLPIEVVYVFLELFQQRLDAKLPNSTSLWKKIITCFSLRSHLPNL